MMTVYVREKENERQRERMRARTMKRAPHTIIIITINIVVEYPTGISSPWFFLRSFCTVYIIVSIKNTDNCTD